jgi:EAL domain-containing protein (putative c-di-GMP-specific phosphodiesterase class I)
MGVSIGIALAPHDETTVEGLVRKADAAMYDAKAAGRARYSFSSEEIEQRNHGVLEMQIKLSKALANQEFKLFLQPQVAFAGDCFKIVGAEALIRWQTAAGEIITPDKFIPLSESNGMIIPIGNWVLEEVFRIDQELKRNGIDIKLAFNVSSKQFESANFVSRVTDITHEHRMQNIKLEIEITESFLLQNFSKAIESLIQLKGLGIEIALDDFGTGFSSLNYLTRLPIDYLKIDKSFIDDIGQAGTRNLTPSIIAMAKTLNIKTVAEGVETQEQMQILLNEGCTEQQGYFFSRPIEISEFLKFYKQNNGAGKIYTTPHYD